MVSTCNNFSPWGSISTGFILRFPDFETEVTFDSSLTSASCTYASNDGHTVSITFFHISKSAKLITFLALASAFLCFCLNFFLCEAGNLDISSSSSADDFEG